MMDVIVQWATILSPIIAVLIAWWMSRSSAKDTAKQIAALEESTTKQVESIKELARLQIEISTLQMSKELSDARSQYIQISKKTMNVLDTRDNMLGIPINDLTSMVFEKREKTNELSIDQEHCIKRINMLNSYMERMNAIKDKLEKE